MSPGLGKWGAPGQWSPCSPGPALGCYSRQQQGWGHVPKFLANLLSLLTARGDAQHLEQGAHPVPSPGELSAAWGSWAVGRRRGLSRAQQRLLTQEGRRFPDLCTHRQGKQGRASPRQGCRGTRAIEAARTWLVSARCLSPLPPYPQLGEGAGATRPCQPAGGTFILPACSRVVTGDWQLPRGQRGGEPLPDAIFSSSRSVFSLTVSPLRSSLGPSIGDVYPAWHLMGCDTGCRGRGGWLPPPCSARLVGAREGTLGGTGRERRESQAGWGGSCGAPWGGSAFLQLLGAPKGCSALGELGESYSTVPIST